ncbi:MAG: hypothetical protein ABEJ72_03175 [Candidatus Aenigmatarchaeota archaeon]
MRRLEVNLTTDDDDLIDKFDEAKPDYRSRSQLVRTLMREYIEEHSDGQENAERS